MFDARRVSLLVSALALTLFTVACSDMPTAPHRSAPATPLTDWVTVTSCRGWDIYNIPDDANVHITTPGGYVDETNTWRNYVTNYMHLAECAPHEVWQDNDDDICQGSPDSCVQYPNTGDGSYDVSSGSGGGYSGGQLIPVPFQFKVSDCNYDLWVSDTTGRMVRDSLKTCQRAFNAAERAQLDTARQFLADTLSTQHFTDPAARNHCAAVFSQIANALASGIDFGVGTKDSRRHGGAGVPLSGIGHIDPMYFEAVVRAQSANAKDDARRELIRTFIHEIGHSFAGYTHAENVGYPYHTADFFKQLNFFGVPNSCVL